MLAACKHTSWICGMWLWLLYENLSSFFSMENSCVEILADTASEITSPNKREETPLLFIGWDGNRPFLNRLPTYHPPLLWPSSLLRRNFFIFLSTIYNHYYTNNFTRRYPFINGGGHKIQPHRLMRTINEGKHFLFIVCPPRKIDLRRRAT